MSATGSRLAAAGERVGKTGKAAARALGAARSGLLRAGAGLGAAIGSLGLLNGVLIGAYAIYAGVQNVLESNKQGNDAIKDIRRPNVNPSDQHAQAKALRKKANAATISNIFSNNFADPILDLFGDHESKFDRYNREADAADRTARGTRRQQRQGKDLSLTTINDNLKRRLNAARNDGEIEVALEKARIEIGNSFARRHGGKTAQAGADAILAGLRGQKAAILAGLGDFEAIRKLVTDLPSLQSFSSKLDLNTAQQGPTKRNITGRAYAVAKGYELSRTNPADAAAEIAAADADAQKLKADAQATLDRKLAVPHSTAAGVQARKGFLRSITRSARLERASGRALEVRIRGTEADERNAQLAVDDAEKAAPFAFGGKATLKAKRRHRNDLKRKLDSLRAQRRAIAGTVSQLERDTALDVANVNQAINDDNNALFDARTGAIVAGISDPAQAQKVEIQRARKNLGRILSQHHGDKQNVEYQNALAALRNAQQSSTQAEIDHFSEGLQVRRSGADIGANESTKLNGALADAKSLLAHLRATGGKQTDINQALIAVNNARGALVDYAKQQAQALISADAELAKSKTDDPVKQAKIDEAATRRLEKFATNPAELTSAKAATNNAHKATIAAGISKREGTIDFNLEMERITKQEAISQLEALSKSRGITTQVKREILTKIKSLKNEAASDTTAFNLGLGNIKLPTAYDVRRGIASVKDASAPALSRAQGGMQASSVANITVNVNDKNAAGEVYGAIDRALRTSVRSRLRNAGVR